MKKILGLDIGTTSIGWALVNEAENEAENANIIKVGVRIVPLTTDEEANFTKGKSITTNADRTLKRGARRSLQRYKLRREQLIKTLQAAGIISDITSIPEDGKCSTHSLWGLRAKAASEKISLNDLVKVLFAINKKRGYKSNRKAKDEADGQAVDGMEIAKYLIENKLTPGQYVLQRLKNNKAVIPEFYQSDIQNEFNRIWQNQRTYYPAILTDELYTSLQGKNAGQTSKICEIPFGIKGIKLEGKRDEVKLKKYEFRVQALSEKIELEHLAIVLQEVNGQAAGTSGYLASISDRSKELYFNKQTVGQYLCKQLAQNPHARLKNQVFYRQDYMDEFNTIWNTQAAFHGELTDKLRDDIRDIIIFYQRPLRSQKGLLSVCELENKQIEVEQNGKVKTKLVGPKVCPRSSPLFQEFKIWQRLNDIEFRNPNTKEKIRIEDFDEFLEFRNEVFHYLTIHQNISDKELLNMAHLKKKDGWELNFQKGIEGNSTSASFYGAYKEIVTLSGHDIDFASLNPAQTKEAIAIVFETLGIKTEILEFDAELEGADFFKQASYEFWHLLYSYEGDNSKTGNEKLHKKLFDNFGIPKEYTGLFVKIALTDDYSSLSTKAISKILPYLKAGHQYDKAAAEAGYRHSKNSLTKAEIENKILADKLELLPKNSLRNPVVEKILNQLVHVVNQVIENYGKPDEVRIELARELKKSAKEREETTSAINKATAEHEKIRIILSKLYPFNTGVRITRNDVIKYKLYQELESTGFKTIYTNIYIPLDKLFSKDFDVEHIIPKAKLFDDSFSNKTLATRDFNRNKGNKTGMDAIVEKYGANSEGQRAYLERIEKLYAEKKISKSKYSKLKMTEQEIPDGFIDRDLRNSQYIAKKSKELLEKVVRNVLPTTGAVTDKLRKDWQLINVLQELNLPKYDKLGLVTYEKNKNGDQIVRITDWTKRNDHRHHIMDAITVAFTKRAHIQYLNFLNARYNVSHNEHGKIAAIENKYTELVADKKGNTKRKITPPMPVKTLRATVKEHLENTLVSFKAKNKVVTKNRNKTKTKTGYQTNEPLTPRGQLHKETVYGQRYRYVTKEEKVSAKFDQEKISQVAQKRYREALLKRLAQFGNDPKKAFSGANALSKTPLYVGTSHNEIVPEKVKLVYQEAYYAIRKEVTPELKLDKVIDVGVRRKLQERLDKFNGKAKEAFANLEENPIWLNKAAGIAIKRVAITGVSNAEPLHIKRDHFGQEIKDENGHNIPADFVSTGNNHHVAIYKDKDGNLQEQVVSFYEAVARRNQNMPIIDKQYNADLGWQFLFTMKQNEMFVFPNEQTGFNPKEIDLLDESNYHLISPYLFRVQKMATKDYWFRHHLETTIDTINKTKDILWKREGLSGIGNIIKVRLNHLGKIIELGD